MKKDAFNLLFLAIIISAQFFIVQAKYQTIPQRVRIIDISGTSEFRHTDKEKWNLLNTETFPKAGWDIKTHKDSKITFSMEPVITVVLYENSLLGLNKLLINKTLKAIRMRFRILKGKLDIKMPAFLGYKLFFTIETPSATIYLRNADINISIKDNTTSLDVLRGTIKVKHNESDIKNILHSGNHAIINSLEKKIQISKFKLKSDKKLKEKKQSYISAAILNIQSKIVTKENLEPVSDYVAQELKNKSNIEVFFLDEVCSLLRKEGVKNLINCTTDSCIFEIGNLIGVDLIVLGKLGQLGKKYIFNLKITDVSRHKNIDRVSKIIDGDISRLLDEIPGMVETLVKKNLINKKSSIGENETFQISDSIPKENIKANMVWIFPGTFTMGSDVTRGNRDEWPAHKVKLNGFFIDKYEVTKKDFELIMGYNPSGFKGCNACPVDNVTWLEADEYCRKVNKRLPTEAEWEYACRAETETVFHYGNTLSSDNANFNGKKPYGGAPPRRFIRKPVPVGNYKPNGWDLYDMHGNLSEWCSDWHVRDYYSISLQKNPNGPENGRYKVLRGGSWRDEGSTLRSANRNSYNPAVRLNTIGFRCAKDFKK